MFNDSIKNSFTFSLDFWSNYRKTVDTLFEYQVDIGSAQNINFPKYIIVGHQTAVGVRTPDKTNNVAVFDNLNVRKYHVDTDGVNKSWDGVSIVYASND